LLLLLYFGKANHGGLDKMMSYEGSKGIVYVRYFGSTNK